MFALGSVVGMTSGDGLVVSGALILSWPLAPTTAAAVCCHLRQRTGLEARPTTTEPRLPLF